jgi:hypothetical protein
MQWGTNVSDSVERRSGIVTALGIASVLLAALFLIASIHGLLAVPSTKDEVSAANLPPVLIGAAGVLAYLKPVVNLVLYGLLFAVGLGLLRRARWARGLARLYAFSQIGWSVLSGLVSIVLTVSHEADTAGLVPSQVAFMENEYIPLAVTLHVAGILLSILWPVILLALLSRPSAKESLEP